MKIIKLNGFWEKLVGLSFKNKITPVYFETRWGIHTCFVKSPIDVLICDDNFVVRKKVLNLKPWRILVWDPKYGKIIELPAGYIELKKIKYESRVNPDKF